MSDSFELDAPDHFTAGAVGPPGQRTFYLQARQLDTLVTLKSEKAHVHALGEHLAGLLAKLEAVTGQPQRDLALIEPIDPSWAVGSLGVGYDEADDRIVVVAEELMEEGSTGKPSTARFSITRAQAAAFVEVARDLMNAGRPTCPVCSLPMDPDGHICPRGNGHFAH